MEYEVVIHLDDSRAGTPGEVGELIEELFNVVPHSRLTINTMEVRKVKDKDNATRKQTRRYH